MVQYRLASTSPTRRVWATCCATPMFLDSEKGFWLSLYPDPAETDDAGLPREASGLQFTLRLAGAFASTGFRRLEGDAGLAGLPELPLQAL